MKPLNDNKSIDDYLNSLSNDRKEKIIKIIDTIKKNIPEGFEFTMSYGMIGWVVPKSIYPAGYHCTPKLPLPFLNVASQKNFVAIYHMGIYAVPELFEWFKNEYSKTCKKPDIGKSCIRFKDKEEIPFELIAELAKKLTPQNWIEIYEKNFKKSV
ncbi:MAG: DUF1801 domain-containing protein [Bacteroidetes bacterium]|nr:DUF1801 domain-containing protein [Bacteroidota bacterium]